MKIDKIFAREQEKMLREAGVHPRSKLSWGLMKLRRRFLRLINHPRKGEIRTLRADKILSGAINAEINAESAYYRDTKIR